jgi:hypothetical protein
MLHGEHGSECILFVLDRWKGGCCDGIEPSDETLKQS